MKELRASSPTGFQGRRTDYSPEFTLARAKNGSDTTSDRWQHYHRASAAHPRDRRSRMILNNRTAYSLLLALSGRVPAGTTPGLDGLLAEQDPDSTIRGVATFAAVPTVEQVRALEELGLAVQ